MREDKDFNKNPKLKLHLILIGFLISAIVIIATTPIHEGAHWIMSDIDPYVEPVEFHVFDDTSHQDEEYVLPSALGSVIIKEKYPGALHDRPWWADILQEIICISIQIFLAVIITFKITKGIANRNQKVLLSMNNS